MSEENKDQDLQPDEELELDLDDDQDDTQDGDQDAGDEKINLAKLKVEDLETMDEATKTKVAKQALIANKRLFARLKPKAKPQEQKPNVQPPAKKDKEEVRDTGTDSRISKLELAEAKRQFGYENNLSPEETDAVFNFTPTPTKETLSNPFVKGGLEAIRAARRANDATPSPSGRAKTFNNKTFEELKSDDQKKNYADHVGALVKGRKR